MSNTTVNLNIASKSAVAVTPTVTTNTKMKTDQQPVLRTVLTAKVPAVFPITTSASKAKVEPRKSIFATVGPVFPSSSSSSTTTSSFSTSNAFFSSSSSTISFLPTPSTSFSSTLLLSDYLASGTPGATSSNSSPSVIMTTPTFTGSRTTVVPTLAAITTSTSNSGGQLFQNYSKVGCEKWTHQNGSTAKLFAIKSPILPLSPAVIPLGISTMPTPTSTGPCMAKTSPRKHSIKEKNTPPESAEMVVSVNQIAKTKTKRSHCKRKLVQAIRAAGALEPTLQPLNSTPSGIISSQLGPSVIQYTQMAIATPTTSQIQELSSTNESSSSKQKQGPAEGGKKRNRVPKSVVIAQTTSTLTNTPEQTTPTLTNSPTQQEQPKNSKPKRIRVRTSRKKEIPCTPCSSANCINANKNSNLNGNSKLGNKGKATVSCNKNKSTTEVVTSHSILTTFPKSATNSIKTINLLTPNGQNLQLLTAGGGTSGIGQFCFPATSSNQAVSSISGASVGVSGQGTAIPIMVSGVGGASGPSSIVFAGGSLGQGLTHNPTLGLSSPQAYPNVSTPTSGLGCQASLMPISSSIVNTKNGGQIAVLLVPSSATGGKPGTISLGGNQQLQLVQLQPGPGASGPGGSGGLVQTIPAAFAALMQQQAQQLSSQQSMPPPPIPVSGSLSQLKQAHKSVITFAAPVVSGTSGLVSNKANISTPSGPLAFTTSNNSQNLTNNISATSMIGSKCRSVSSGFSSSTKKQSSLGFSAHPNNANNQGNVSSENTTEIGLEHSFTPPPLPPQPRQYHPQNQTLPVKLSASKMPASATVPQSSLPATSLAMSLMTPPPPLTIPISPTSGYSTYSTFSVAASAVPPPAKRRKVDSVEVATQTDADKTTVRGDTITVNQISLGGDRIELVFTSSAPPAIGLTDTLLTPSPTLALMQQAPKEVVSTSGCVSAPSFKVKDEPQSEHTSTTPTKANSTASKSKNRLKKTKVKVDDEIIDNKVLFSNTAILTSSSNAKNKSKTKQEKLTSSSFTNIKESSSSTMETGSLANGSNDCMLPFSEFGVNSDQSFSTNSTISTISNKGPSLADLIATDSEEFFRGLENTFYTSGDLISVEMMNSSEFMNMYISGEGNGEEKSGNKVCEDADKLLAFDGDITPSLNNYFGNCGSVDSFSSKSFTSTSSFSTLSTSTSGRAYDTASAPPQLLSNSGQSDNPLLFNSTDPMLSSNAFIFSPDSVGSLDNTSILLSDGNGSASDSLDAAIAEVTSVRGVGGISGLGGALLGNGSLTGVMGEDIDGKGEGGGGASELLFQMAEIGQMKMDDEFPLCDVDMVNKVLSDLELEKALDFAFLSTASELCCFGGFNGDLSCDDHLTTSMKRSFEEEGFGRKSNSCTSGSAISSHSFVNDKSSLGSLMSSSASSSFESCNSGSVKNFNTPTTSGSLNSNTSSLTSLVAPVNHLPVIKKPRSRLSKKTSPVSPLSMAILGAIETTTKSLADCGSGCASTTTPTLSGLLMSTGGVGMGGLLKSSGRHLSSSSTSSNTSFSSSSSSNASSTQLNILTSGIGPFFYPVEAAINDNSLLKSILTAPIVNTSTPLPCAASISIQQTLQSLSKTTTTSGLNCITSEAPRPPPTATMTYAEAKRLRQQLQRRKLAAEKQAQKLAAQEAGIVEVKPKRPPRPPRVRAPPKKKVIVNMVESGNEIQTGSSNDQAVVTVRRAEDVVAEMMMMMASASQSLENSTEANNVEKMAKPKAKSRSKVQKTVTETGVDESATPTKLVTKKPSPAKVTNVETKSMVTKTPPKPRIRKKPQGCSNSKNIALNLDPVTTISSTLSNGHTIVISSTVASTLVSSSSSTSAANYTLSK